MNLSALSSWIEILGWTLLHFLWQGVAIGLLYLLLRVLCSTPAARYRMGLCALIVMLAAPAITMWRLASVESTTATTNLSAIADEPISALVGSANQISFAQRLDALLPWLVGAWFCGVFVIATRSLIQWRQLVRLTRRAAPLPSEWQERVALMCRRIGVRQKVRLLAAVDVSTPVLMGLLKPVILLPASVVTGFSVAQIELIIAHELAHARRYDYLANLIQTTIVTLFFYHPVVQWVSRDVRNAREQSCDDLVLGLGNSPLIYARTLTRLEELRLDGPLGAPALGAAGGALLARIRRIVEPEQTWSREAQEAKLALTPIALLVLAAALFVWNHVRELPVWVDNIAVGVARNAPWVSAPSIAVGKIAFEAIRPSLPSHIWLVTHDEANRENLTEAQIVSTHDPAHDTSLMSAPVIPVIDQSMKASAPSIATAAPEIAKISLNDVQVTPTAAAAQSRTSLTPDRVVQPVYPTDALRRGQTGAVELEFRLGVDGTAQDIRVVRGSDPDVFDKAAITALRQWHFPGGESSTAAYHVQRFAFALANADARNCYQSTGSHICRYDPSDSGH